MPYTLKTNQISVKDPETGEYSGVDILAEQTEQGLIAELQAEGTTQVNRINQAAVNVQAAVDQAESDAATIISNTQTSINTLEAQKNTIAQTVASMAELGTDTTLSTPGMAADAGAVGDLSRQISDVEDTVISSAYEYTSYQCADIGTAYTQYSGGPSGSPVNGITISRNTSYDSYVIDIDRDTKIYIDTTGISYYALSVGIGGTGTWYSVGTNEAYKHDFSSAVRYRLSDGNLPTASNPLNVSAGTILVVSVTATKSPAIYIQNATKTVKAKFGQIGCSVGDSEITLTGTNYKAILRKTQTTQGYQWNLDDVVGQTKSILSADTDIVGVLRFEGQSNFMGGKHGNEDVVDFKVFAEGTDIVDGESYEQVTVLMLSHLYDPDNTASNPVDRIVEMIFRPDGWTSRVTFLILTTATIDTAYPCGLYGFNAADANYCITNVGKLDLTTTISQPIANKNLKQLTVNLTDNATVTIVGEEFDATPFVTYRRNTESFKVYWPKARSLSVSSGDVITGLCRYYI